MKKTFVILGVLLMAVAASAQQVAKGLTASNGEYVGFYEYKPTDYNTGTKYPVIIFLHGIGERGNGTSDLPRVLGNGTPNNIQNGHTMRFFWNGKWETFLVLTPQLNSKYGWWPTWYVDEMIKYAKANLSIDQNRIFLTGLSLGGGGVWAYAAGSLDNAKQLAGIGVSCGTCQNVNWGNIANANLPTWAWHASDDGTVPSSCSKGAVDAINALNPAVRAYVTIWPTGQHWIWGKVYNVDYEAQHPNIYEWFLGQNKSLAPNKRPVANAGPDQTISTLGGTATLTGASSTDADGNIVRYVWTKVSGPSFGTIASPVTTSATTTISGLNYPGTYVYELRVLDNRADWTTDQVTITVTDSKVPDPTGNKAPVARAGNDVTMTLPNNSATLNGTGSSDPDGSISSYSWSKVAGPSQFTLNNATSASASVSGLAQGTYTFRLTVKDNNGATNSDDVNITVNASGSTSTKVANAGGNITIALPTNSTTLNGSGSTDPGGAIKQYEWSKVSGPSQFTIANSKSASTAISNLAQGVYQFKLTVWNHDWVPSSDTTTVTVNAGGGSGGGGSTGKIANAGADISITLPTNTTQLNAYGSSDPGGEIKAYEWSKVSGPSQFTLADAKKPITGVSNLVQGTYVIKLTVWDHNWVPSSDELTLTVNGSGSSGGGVPGRIPNAGDDIYLTLPTNSTTLNGSASKDPGGEIKAYEWSKLSGPSATIANPKSATTSVSNLVEGLYKFKLTVWDHRWVPSNDTVDVIVKASGSGSTGNLWSNAGEDIYITLPVNSTTLNGYASKSPDGRSFKQYQWKKVSGPAQYTITNPNAQATTLTNLAQGSYSFELTVWNADWVPKSDIVNVYVMSATSASKAALGTTEVLMSAKTTGGPEATTVDQLTVYPNPAHGLVNVQTISEEVGQAVINIYDVSGRNVQKVTFQKAQSLQQQSLNVTRLTPGIYNLEVVINNKRKMITKFVKQ